MGDSLDGSEWDVTIVGTGLQEASLARALANLKLKILHVDPNPFYGAGEAALSLQEFTQWAQRFKDDDSGTVFSNARTWCSSAETEAALRQNRHYSFLLAPQNILCSSKIIESILERNLSDVIELVAVSNWWAYLPPTGDTKSQLVAVPGSREEIFRDQTIDIRTKRSLIKFLLFIANYENDPDWPSLKELALPDLLSTKFKLPMKFHPIFLSLIMSYDRPESLTAAVAVPRVFEYVRSLGLYGPGFAGLLFRYGGLSELIQTLCRHSAVGGATYILGTPIESVELLPHEAVPVKPREGEAGSNEPVPSKPLRYGLRLANGDRVRTRWLAGFSEGACPAGMPSQEAAATASSQPAATKTAHAVYLVSSELARLFPRPSDPEFHKSAVSVVYVPVGALPLPDAVAAAVAPAETSPPVYLFIHGSDSGECPAGQSVVYANMNHVSAKANPLILRLALDTVLGTTGLDSDPVEGTETTEEKVEVVWSTSFVRQSATDADLDSFDRFTERGGGANRATAFKFPGFLSRDGQFDDRTMGVVKSGLEAIMSDYSERE